MTSQAQKKHRSWLRIWFALSYRTVGDCRNLSLLVVHLIEAQVGQMKHRRQRLPDLRRASCARCMASGRFASAGICEALACRTTLLYQHRKRRHLFQSQLVTGSLHRDIGDRQETPTPSSVVSGGTITTIIPGAKMQPLPNYHLHLSLCLHSDGVESFLHSSELRSVVHAVERCAAGLREDAVRLDTLELRRFNDKYSRAFRNKNEGEQDGGPTSQNVAFSSPMPSQQPTMYYTSKQDQTATHKIYKD